jgi:hypothetical protein
MRGSFGSRRCDLEFPLTVKEYRAPQRVACLALVETGMAALAQRRIVIQPGRLRNDLCSNRAIRTPSWPDSRSDSRSSLPLMICAGQSGVIMTCPTRTSRT